MEQTLNQDVIMKIIQSLALCGGYAAIGLAAIGSSIGAGIAGSAAIGAWKRRYMMNKPAPFLLTVFAGSPLSQTIYALVLMMVIKGKMDPENPMMLFHFMLGIFAGVGFMFSSIYQGKAAAAACDAFGETEKGFANSLMILGVIETVSLFVLVFAIMVL